METKLSQIVGDVRVAMDMDRVPGSLLSAEDLDTLTTDEAIRSVIPDAVRMAHTDAPYHLLELGHQFGDDGVLWGDLCSGWVLLPDDFMRLVVFQMSDWLQPAYGVLTPADPLYSLQKSPLRCMRATYEDPVCAIVQRPEGKVLEFYSCRSEDAEISKAAYIPYPEIRDGHIDISPRCYSAVVALAASICQARFGNEQASTFLLNQYQQLLR